MNTMKHENTKDEFLMRYCIVIANSLNNALNANVQHFYCPFDLYKLTNHQPLQVNNILP